MNSLEKVSIVLILVLIGALVAAHRRQRLIDREAAHIVSDAVAAQQRYFDRKARSQLDAIGDSIVAARVSAAERSFYLNVPPGSNNVAFVYNALDQTTGTDNVAVGEVCPKGWHLVIDGRIPTVQCEPKP